MSLPIGGNTWFGNQPVPMSSLSLAQMKNNPAMMLPEMGKPKGPTASARSTKVGIGGMMPRRSMMPGGGLGVNNSMSMAPLPAPMMGGGGGGSRGGGGGGQSFSFAPTNYSNGDRYNAQGYRPDGRRQILGGVSRNSGGLSDLYAMEAMPGASPEERNAAVDALGDGGQVAGFGGYGTAPKGTMPKQFALGTMPGETTPTREPFSINELPGQQEIMAMPDGTQVIPPPGLKLVQSPVPMKVLPAFSEMQPAPGWAAGAIVPPPITTMTGEMAPFQGPQPMNFAATPAAPMPVPTKQGFADALMNAPSPDGRPAGVKPTDWKRFMKSPQGMGFAMDQQQGQQRFGQMMALEDQRYQRARQDKLADMTAEQRAAQMEKDRDADALTAGYDLMLKDYAGKGHLSPDQLAVFGAAKDPKTRAMMGKVLASMAEMNMTAAAEKAKQEQMMAPPVPLGEVPGTGQLAVRVGNETRMVPKQQAPKDLTLRLTKLPTGEYVYQHPETGSPLLDLGVFDEVKAGPEGNMVARPMLQRRDAPKPEKVITDPTSLQAAAVEVDPRTGRALGLRKLSEVRGTSPAESAKSPAQQNADDIKRLLGGK